MKEKRYFDNGQVEFECQHKANNRKVLRVWHPNGQLKYEKHYKGYDRCGRSREWYANGQLMKEIYYKSDEYHGLCRKWHENGAIMIEKRFRDGRAINIPAGVLFVSKARIVRYVMKRWIFTANGFTHATTTGAMLIPT
jgi:hypothetical protein